MTTVNGVCSSLVMLVKKCERISWVWRCMCRVFFPLRHDRNRPASMAASITTRASPPHMSRSSTRALFLLSSVFSKLMAVVSRTCACTDFILSCRESVRTVYRSRWISATLGSLCRRVCHRPRSAMRSTLGEPHLMLCSKAFL